LKIWKSTIKRKKSILTKKCLNKDPGRLHCLLRPSFYDGSGRYLLPLLTFSMESGFSPSVEMRGSGRPGITEIINRLLQTGVCGADGSLAPAGEVNPDPLPTPKNIKKK
jgi:hypothetical protein